jgi:acyl carrier protein
MKHTQTREQLTGIGLRDIEAVVINIIKDCAGHLSIAVPIDRASRVESLRIDSLRMVQIVFELETTLGMELPEHALFQLDTVGDLIDLVRLSCCPMSPGGPWHQIWPSRCESWSNLPQ